MSAGGTSEGLAVRGSLFSRYLSTSNAEEVESREEVESKDIELEDASDEEEDEL